MQIEIPIFRQILLDADLAPRDFQVWRCALELLDLVEWRELKSLVLERTLKRDKATISRSLNALVDLGYLMRRRPRGSVTQYRVPLSRADASAERDTSVVTEVADGEAVAPLKRKRARVISTGVL